MLPLLVNIRFQVLFHSPPGVLFTFPSRYWFAIGHQVVFSLGGWSPLIPTGFLVSCATLDTHGDLLVSLTGLLPYFVLFSNNLLLQTFLLYWVLTPSILLQMVWALSLSLTTT